jgi:hypothetical protein
MAPTTALNATPPAAATALRVGRVVSAGAYTALHAGAHVVVLPCRPSGHAARSATAQMRQVVAVEVVIAHGEVRALVRGVRHRAPIEQPCALSGALALAKAGVPTRLVTDHSVGEGSPERRDAGFHGVGADR